MYAETKCRKGAVNEITVVKKTSWGRYSLTTNVRYGQLHIVAQVLLHSFMIRNYIRLSSCKPKLFVLHSVHSYHVLIFCSYYLI